MIPKKIVITPAENGVIVQVEFSDGRLGIADDMRIRIASTWAELVIAISEAGLKQVLGLPEATEWNSGG